MCKNKQAKQQNNKALARPILFVQYKAFLVYGPEISYSRFNAINFFTLCSSAAVALVFCM